MLHAVYNVVRVACEHVRDILSIVLEFLRLSSDFYFEVSHSLKKDEVFKGKLISILIRVTSFSTKIIQLALAYHWHHTKSVTATVDLILGRRRASVILLAGGMGAARWLPGTRLCPLR